MSEHKNDEVLEIDTEFTDDLESPSESIYFRND